MNFTTGYAKTVYTEPGFESTRFHDLKNTLKKTRWWPCFHDATCLAFKTFLKVLCLPTYLKLQISKLTFLLNLRQANTDILNNGRSWESVVRRETLLLKRWLILLSIFRLETWWNKYKRLNNLKKCSWKHCRLQSVYKMKPRPCKQCQNVWTFSTRNVWTCSVYAQCVNLW